MNFLTNINLTQNQIQNAVLHPLTNAPAGVEGQVYYNSVTKHLCIHNGTDWTDLTGGGSGYSLPIASAAALGGVKVGSGLAIDGAGVLSTVLQTIKVNGSSLVINSNAVDILIGVGTSNGQIKVNGSDIAIYTHPTYTAADTSNSVAPGYAGTFTVVDEVTRTNGHVTGINVKTVTMPTAYVHPTDDGNLHVPANGTTNNGKILTADGTAGSYSWQTNAPLWVNIQNKPTSTVADIDSAVSLKHTQNTDTGTSSASFLIDNDNGTNGVMLKTSAGELQLRSNTDGAYANLRVKDLYVEGTQTIINSNTVDIGDSNITLNSDIATSAANSDGGISVKRLMADNTTRKDAVLEYNISTDKWQTAFGAVDGTLVTLPLTNKYTTTLGNAVDSTFVVTHNLNTRDVAVTIRETGDDYEVVYTDVKVTTANTATVSFATAPTAAQYTITIVG